MQQQQNTDISKQEKPGSASHGDFVFCKDCQLPTMRGRSSCFGSDSHYSPGWPRPATVSAQIPFTSKRKEVLSKKAESQLIPLHSLLPVQKGSTRRKDRWHPVSISIHGYAKTGTPCFCNACLAASVSSGLGIQSRRPPSDRPRAADFASP